MAAQRTGATATNLTNNDMETPNDNQRNDPDAPVPPAAAGSTATGALPDIFEVELPAPYDLDNPEDSKEVARLVSEGRSASVISRPQFALSRSGRLYSR